MKRFSVRFLFCLCVALFVLFLLSPDLVQRTAHESVLFCAAVIIPSLFPGYVLADLLLSLSGPAQKKGGLFSRVFRLPPSMVRCWLIGLLAGFPAAADCAVRMVQTGEVSKDPAERCLAFTNNPGIVFVICAVGGGLFGSFAVGLYLWILQTVSAFFVGFLFAKPGGEQAREHSCTEGEISLRRVFPKAVVSSVSAVLNICGFIVFFRVLIAVLTYTVSLDPIKIFLAGLLEMTCGISQLSEFGVFTAVTASFILGWSGFSVHFQILNVLSQADLSPKYYFPGKVLQAVFFAGLTLFTYPLFFDCSNQRSAIPLLCLLLFVVFLVFLRFRKEYLYGKRNL